MVDKRNPRKPTHPEVTWRQQAEIRRANKDTTIRMKFPPFVKEVLDALVTPDPESLTVPNASDTTVLKILIDRDDVKQFLRKEAGFDDKRIRLLRATIETQESDEQIDHLSVKINTDDLRKDALKPKGYQDGYEDGQDGSVADRHTHDDGEGQWEGDRQTPSMNFTRFISEAVKNRSLANAPKIDAPSAFTALLRLFMPDEAEAIDAAMEKHSDAMLNDTAPPAKVARKKREIKSKKDLGGSESPDDQGHAL